MILRLKEKLKLTDEQVKQLEAINTEFQGKMKAGGEAVRGSLGGAIRELIEGGDFKGKKGEVAVLYPRGAITARRVLLVGLGKQQDFDLEGVRQAAAAGIARAAQLNARQVATIVHGAGVGGLEPQAAAQATAEGSLLASYVFDAPKQKEPSNIVESLTVVELEQTKVAAMGEGVRLAGAIYAGNSLARDLVNLPPNYATPEHLAQTAREIAAEHGLGVTIGDRAWAAAHKMGAFLAVALGAGFDPRFIVLEHNAGRADLPTIVLVGKGITFDTGGITIKAGAEMWTMKSDMGGAAAVLGTMKTVGILKPELRVIGLAPCTENMPDANAYRPADVITASNGKTIEIISTDAEGRMVLADALVYAGRYQPDAVIDLATLTGSCVVALGRGRAAGLFSNDEGLQAKLVAAGQASHERLWPLPLWPEYKESIKSDVADMKNSGGRFGGVATSAVFLQEFTDYTWAHLDIAGMALADKPSAYTPKGGTGFGVRLLVEFLRRYQ